MGSSQRSYKNFDSGCYMECFSPARALPAQDRVGLGMPRPDEHPQDCWIFLKIARKRSIGDLRD